MSMPSSSALVAETASRSPSLSRCSSSRRSSGQVATAVWRHPPRQVWVDIVQAGLGLQRHRLGTATTSHERQRPHAVGHQVGHQVGGFEGRRTAYGRPVLAQCGGERRLPQRHRCLSARRPVDVDRLDRYAGQPGRGEARLGRRGRREHERRTRAVVRGDPAQPPQDLCDVRAEDPAVVVALVDDHIAERSPERRPARVRRQHRAMQHVGIRQHVVRVVAGEVTLLRGRVAVVRRRAHAGHRQSRHRTELVLSERLGR